MKKALPLFILLLIISLLILNIRIFKPMEYIGIEKAKGIALDLADLDETVARSPIS